jgi:hypothetical protein
MSDSHDSDSVLRSVLESQYHAALAMLRPTLEHCPDDVWFDRNPVNAFWQIAYHTLFYTHLYLQPNEAAFRPWERHQKGIQHLGGAPGRAADPNNTLPLIAEPYSRADVMAYWDFCEQMVDGGLATLDLNAPESGFSWYKVSKLEHQLISIRHIQHHTAQLMDRLRATTNIGVAWVGSRRADRPSAAAR